MTRPRLVLLGLAALAVVLVVLVPGRSGDDRGGDRSRSGASATSTSPLLDISLTTFDGAPVALRAYAGRPLVVNFFASWCGPCAREMPDFESVHAARDDVRFVGVNLQDEPDAAIALVERAGVTYDVVRDADGELFRAVQGFSMPTTVFLDVDGRVVEVHGGELSRGALVARVDRLVRS